MPVTNSKPIYTVHKCGDDYAIYFRGTRDSGPLHATRKTANKYASIMELEYTQRTKAHANAHAS